jgi:hypothetical protein
MNAPGLCRWRYSWHPGGATLPESLRYLVSQSWAAGWSYLLAVTSETAERVRVGAACVGAGWCCSRNPGAENDNSAGQYFCDQLVVLILHLILCPSR